jgi:hypothetical protein
LRARLPGNELRLELHALMGVGSRVLALADDEIGGSVAEFVLRLAY